MMKYSERTIYKKALNAGYRVEKGFQHYLYNNAIFTNWNGERFTNGYVGRLRNGAFPDDRLKTISEYLDVSFDYLLTGVEREVIIETAKKNATLIKLPSRIKEYALKLAEMPKEQQEQIMSLIDMLSDKKDEK